MTAPGFQWLPIALGLCSAFLYGVSAVCSRRGVLHLEPQLAAVVSIGSTALTFLVTSPLWMRAEDWLSPGFWVFALNGLIHPMLSVWCWLEAIQRAGPTVASTLTATAPLFATATAATVRAVAAVQLRYETGLDGVDRVSLEASREAGPERAARHPARWPSLLTAGGARRRTDR